MALNFPTSPSLNDTFSSGGITWVWNGSSWTTNRVETTFDSLSDVTLTGAANNDLLYRSGGAWIDTAGQLTWDGSTLLATAGTISGASVVALSNTLEVQGSFPFLQLNQTDGGTDQKKWVWIYDNTALEMRAVNDASSAYSQAFVMSRSGYAISSLTFGNATDNPTYTFSGTGLTTVGGALTVVGAVNAKAGTVSSPSINFSDATTGFYKATTDSIGVTIAGTQRLIFDSTGIVTASAKFYGPGGSAAAPTYSFVSDSNSGMYGNNAGEIYIVSDGTARLTVNSSGATVNGGLSASSVVATSSVMEIQGAYPFLQLNQTDGGTNEKRWVWIADGTAMELRAVNDASDAYTNAFTFTRSAQNVSNLTFGNATSNPTYTFAGTGGLSFAGGYVTGALVYDGAGYAAFRNTANTIGFDIGLLGGNSDPVAYLMQRANAALAFGTNNSERMRISADGTLTIAGSAVYPSSWIAGFQSTSDFVNGTLVATDIDASVTDGDSFVIEIMGKTYDSSNPPVKVIAQGYLYNNGIISQSGISYGGTFAPTIKIFNDGGVLKFWWARISYWNSFNVSVYAMTSATNGNLTRNRVTSITDATEPTGSKKVTVTPRVVWHDGNDGSGSGLDADLLDGNQASAFALSSHTHSTLSMTAAGSHITFYESDGPDANDRGILEVNGGNFNIYTHDNSTNTWKLPFSANLTTGNIDIGDASGRLCLQAVMTGAGNANNMYVDGYGKFTLWQNGTGATNVPEAPDNANGLISFETHAGGYGRQFYFPDNANNWVRYHQNGAWGSWRKIQTLDSSGNHDEPLTIYRTGTSELALRIYNNQAGAVANTSIHLGYPTEGYGWRITSNNNPSSTYAGNLQFTRGVGTSTYTVAGYFDNSSNLFLNASAIVGTGYRYYMDGGSSIGMGYNGTGTYSPVQIYGSKSSYGGFYDNYSAVNMMWDSSGNGGEYRSAWRTYWSTTNACMGIDGSTTSSSYSMYVSGAIYATGDIVAFSDERKKENIVTVENALEKLNKLRGVYYNKIGEEKRNVGVIAQEVEKILPEVVTHSMVSDDNGEERDEYGVDYGKMVGLLIEAVKELSAEVKMLKETR